MSNRKEQTNLRYPLFNSCFTHISSDTILGITFHGSAHVRFNPFLTPPALNFLYAQCPYSPFFQLFNGRFWRLSTIHRTGDTSFTVDGTKVRLTGELSIVLLPWDFKLGMPINVISSQHRGGGPHRPLRCLSGVHGHRGKLGSNFFHLATYQHPIPLPSHARCPPGSRQTLQTLEYTLTLRFVKIRNFLALPILFPDGRCQRGRTAADQLCHQPRRPHRH